MSRPPLLAFTALCLLASLPGAESDRPTPGTKAPPWNARGVGPLPWQGIACLDISADATRIALGTIAPAGDDNVLLLDGDGRLLRQQRAGERWVQQVALAPDEVVRALCTMPQGRAGDLPELFRLGKDSVAPEGVNWRRGDYTDVYFHYGDHSNHISRLLARHGDFTAVTNGDQVTWLSPGAGPTTATFPLRESAIPISLACAGKGLVVVGTTGSSANLHLLSQAHPRPLWSHPLSPTTEAAPRLEKGLYGTPALPDGKRSELPQRDEKVWAPLAVALHAPEGAPKGSRRIASADHQGWQRWIRSSATGKEQNYGVRFMPSRPTVTVYDEDGKVVRTFAPATFRQPLWCRLQFLPDGRRLLAWPRSWASRGLAGQPILPADDHASTLYLLDTQTGKSVPLTFPDAIADVALSARGAAVSCWDGRIYLLSERALLDGRLPAGIGVGGPSLVRASRDGKRIVVAGTNGVVRLLDGMGKEVWKNDLNKSVKRQRKPWVANARAVPVGRGVWNLPGGRVESDLGGQWLIEAPDGLILIEGHSGLSFEREWAAIEAVGLDPKKVRYVLATHEHGDHAPGAYLWRVATGAKFVCSREMAYTLQHHIPIGTGYGFNPPVPTDVVITRDTTLDLAGLKVQAVRIPGHTYGSMAWRFEKGGKSYLSFGDLIMPRGVLGYSGSINFSARDALQSLRKLQALKPDVVLPGHGATGPPANYLAAGIDVGVAGGWGLVRPERPNPYFRITQKNVVVVAWNVGATSAAFGDVDGDGRPDVVVVIPSGEGSRVQIYLNKGGKFGDRPDHEVRLPGVARPSKVRVLPGGKGKRANLFVAGKSAALLVAEGKLPGFTVRALDVGDAHQLRMVEQGGRKKAVVARRFGGLEVVEETKGRPRLAPFLPAARGAYLDVQEVDVGEERKALVTSYGQVFLRQASGKLPDRPTLTLETQKGDWSFLAVGDFNGDGKPDVALLSYGMVGRSVARVFYNKGNAARPFAQKPDAVIPLGVGKGTQTLLRDAPVVCDWDGDGIADLVVGKGQHDEVLVLLGGRGGLDGRRTRTIRLDCRVHYETGMYVGDFNGDGRADLAVFGYTLTGVGWNGPTAAYLWLQPARGKKAGRTGG